MATSVVAHLSAASALVALLMVTPASAGAIATWTYSAGPPQVVMQDDATGQILYSVCNSNDTAIWTGNTTYSFIFDDGFAPKNGSALAGTGYTGLNNYATLWYFTDDNSIYQTLWQCDESGQLIPYGTSPRTLISASLSSIHPNSTIAAVLLGAEAGYRVYYQTKDLATASVVYTTQTGWNPGYDISQDPVKKLPISAAFTTPQDVTIVTPRDNTTIEVSNLQQNGTWIISTFPTPLANVGNGTTKVAPTNATSASAFHLQTNGTTHEPLEAWDGNTAGIGITIDSNLTRRIFYIGTDSRIHCQAEGSATWNKCADVDPSSWPVADGADAQLAVTYDVNNDAIWLFFKSHGQMTQVYRSGNNSWNAAVTLPSTIPSPTPQPSSHTGLSKGAQAGIGVGVSVAALAVIGIVIFVLLRHRRVRKEREQAARAAEVSAAAESVEAAEAAAVLETKSADQTSNYIHATSEERNAYSPPLVFEMASPENTHEMAHDDVVHEMYHDGNFPEMPPGHGDTK
ncbi:hypothetical protein F5Y16DRAFT_27940 [Xylariaceae sp. FL0255]|nr:hypothetical protein F5Y16DRAFT_27940 [Xylariaceae sp. FL0255]